MNTTLTIVGGLVAIAVVIVPYLKNKLMKIATIGFLIGGIGIGGAFLAGWFHATAKWAAGIVPSATVAGVATILGLPALFWVLHDLWPRHRATKTTAILAFILPSLFAAVTGHVGDSVNSALHSFGNGAASAFASWVGVS